ncbi:MULTISPECIES: 1-phosphofructokinase family hexose kinase [unclassified Leifsonia]|uniref:1-phosphofructokinase family hexose kinase n=1 Tax=unclassified Leifsonia TaxID=2663824 RepID=UPI000700F6DD|nr:MULTISPECIES: PfkB family carbohydrate kinase [unclassified Leifsonia]KQX08148.1 hypothetical protein ASC59_10780 [Leifsonia sp. Root1293]KRA12429.1 hypothetical protein ASD61_10780 [Leifsonia sp. Root60]
MIRTLGFSPSLDVVYTVDAVTLGAIHRPTRVLRTAGGKSLNVARSLVTLGRPAAAIVPLGGRIGELIVDLLQPSPIELTVVQTTSETRMCVTAADAASGTLTEFYERAPTPDPAAVTEILHHIDAGADGDILAISGAIPDGLDVAAVVAALARASARGVRIAVDVHGPALGAIVGGVHPWVVKVNRSEAAPLTGLAESADLAAHAARLREAGAGIVVLTDGADGSFAADADGSAWRATSARTAGAFPVGSGDAFFAGLLAELDDGCEVPRALLTAAACGGANADVAGAGVFDLATVEECRAMTRVVGESDSRADNG